MTTKPQAKTIDEIRNFRDFARQHYGLQLTEIQAKMYESVKDNRTLFLPRKHGVTMFNEICRQYLKELNKENK